MKYTTLARRIKEETIRMNEALLGEQDYDKGIEALSATQAVCKYTIMFLAKCKADNIPFGDYEIKMKE